MSHPALDLAHRVLAAHDVDALAEALATSASQLVDASHVACALVGSDGGLRVRVRGFGRDPALALSGEAANRFCSTIYAAATLVVVGGEHNQELLAELRSVEARITSALFQPLRDAAGGPAGWIAVYGLDPSPSLSAEDLDGLASVGRIATLGLGQIAERDQLRRAVDSRGAEARSLAERLDAAVGRAQALRRDAESVVAARTHALMEANRELKETHADAIQATRLHCMSQVTASFAHEVNNPMAGLTSNLEIMRECLDELRARVAGAGAESADGLRAIEEFEEIIDDSRDAAQRVAGIIHSLKRLGGEDERDGTFSLNAVVADALTIVQDRLDGSAELDLRFGTLPAIAGDRLDIGHAALSVISNAIEAIERASRRGVVRVTTSVSQGTVALEVADDGPGIEPELLQRVFLPFATTKEEPSAGLGLYCAYQAVERHGGSIRVRSRVGVGTWVRVVLPG